MENSTKIFLTISVGKHFSFENVREELRVQEQVPHTPTIKGSGQVLHEYKSEGSTYEVVGQGRHFF
jgi:hypothetical protein